MLNKNGVLVLLYDVNNNNNNNRPFISNFLVQLYEPFLHSALLRVVSQVKLTTLRLFFYCLHLLRLWDKEYVKFNLIKIWEELGNTYFSQMYIMMFFRQDLEGWNMSCCHGRSRYPLYWEKAILIKWKSHVSTILFFL